MGKTWTMKANERIAARRMKSKWRQKLSNTSLHLQTRHLEETRNMLRKIEKSLAKYGAQKVVLGSRLPPKANFNILRDTMNEARLSIHLFLLQHQSVLWLHIQHLAFHWHELGLHYHPAQGRFAEILGPPSKWCMCWFIMIHLWVVS